MWSIVCKNNICATCPPDGRQPYHSQWQWQLGLSNWKLCVLLLQFLINFKRFAGAAEAAAGQGTERSKGSRVAAALLAADLWQWQIKPMGVATTLLLLLPSSICVCVCVRDMESGKKALHVSVKRSS